jgi:subtilisin-like proprotein convertase family protein
MIARRSSPNPSAVRTFRPTCEELESRLVPAVSLRSFNGMYQGIGQGTGTIVLTGESGEITEDVIVKVTNGKVKVLAPTGNGQIQTGAVKLRANGTAALNFKVKVTESGITANLQVRGTARKQPDGDIGAKGTLKSLTPGLTVSSSSFRVERFTASLGSTLIEPIPDNGTIDQSLFVADTAGTLRDIDVFLDIAHNFNGDLDVTLTHVPSGRSVVLTSDNGASDNGFRVYLNDEAITSITSIDNADDSLTEGLFKPESALSAFDGVDASGEWRLVVTDDAGSDVGSLIAWTLFFTWK